MTKNDWLPMFANADELQGSSGTVIRHYAVPIRRNASARSPANNDLEEVGHDTTPYDAEMPQYLSAIVSQQHHGLNLAEV